MPQPETTPRFSHMLQQQCHHMLHSMHPGQGPAYTSAAPSAAPRHLPHAPTRSPPTDNNRHVPTAPHSQCRQRRPRTRAARQTAKVDTTIQINITQSRLDRHWQQGRTYQHRATNTLPTQRHMRTHTSRPGCRRGDWGSPTSECQTEETVVD